MRLASVCRPWQPEQKRELFRLFVSFNIVKYKFDTVTVAHLFERTNKTSKRSKSVRKYRPCCYIVSLVLFVCIEYRHTDEHLTNTQWAEANLWRNGCEWTEFINNNEKPNRRSAKMANKRYSEKISRCGMKRERNRPSECALMQMKRAMPNGDAVNFQIKYFALRFLLAMFSCDHWSVVAQRQRNTNIWKALVGFVERIFHVIHILFWIFIFYFFTNNARLRRFLTSSSPSTKYIHQRLLTCAFFVRFGVAGFFERTSIWVCCVIYCIFLFVCAFMIWRDNSRKIFSSNKFALFIVQYVAQTHKYA